MTSIECDVNGRMGYVISQFESALRDVTRLNASPGYSNNGAQEYNYVCGMFRMLLDEEVFVLSALCPSAVRALRSELHTDEIQTICSELDDVGYNIYLHGEELINEYALVRKVNCANAEKERLAAAEEASRIAREQMQREKLRRTCPYCGKEFAHVGTKDRHVALRCMAAPAFMEVFKEAFADLNGRAYMTDDAENGMRVQRRIAY